MAERLSHTVYNVSAGTAHSLAAIAAAVAGLVPGPAWVTADTPEGADLVVRPPSERGPLDLGRLRGDLGFVPRFTLEEGLARYLEWLRAAGTGGAMEGI